MLDHDGGHGQVTQPGQEPPTSPPQRRADLGHHAPDRKTRAQPSMSRHPPPADPGRGADPQRTRGRGERSCRPVAADPPPGSVRQPAVPGRGACPTGASGGGHGMDPLLRSHCFKLTIVDHRARFGQRLVAPVRSSNVEVPGARPPTPPSGCWHLPSLLQLPCFLGQPSSCCHGHRRPLLALPGQVPARAARLRPDPRRALLPATMGAAIWMPGGRSGFPHLRARGWGGGGQDVSSARADGGPGPA